MKIRTVIIDDEPIALAKLKNYVEKTPFLELVGEYPSAVNAMEILAEGNVDAVFTDINMPDMDGLQFIGTLSNPPIVVFITAYSQYAVESYRLSAIDYLLKPYGFSDCQRASNKVLKAYNARIPQVQMQSLDNSDRKFAESIFIKVDYRYIRVNLTDILYIKGYGEYLQIYIDGESQPLLTLSSFAAIMELLPENFLQIHRSYIVNMNRIDQVEKARVIIGQERLPVSDSFKRSFQEYLASHSL